MILFQCTPFIPVKLLPFFITTALYFAFVRKEPEGELWTTVLKCLPIFGLMIFILTHKLQNNCYLQKILLGLVFSVTGDALLNLDLFPHGMGAFAVAQIFYISAYGLKPLKFHLSIPFYALGLASEYLWCDCSMKIISNKTFSSVRRCVRKIGPSIDYRSSSIRFSFNDNGVEVSCPSRHLIQLLQHIMCSWKLYVCCV